MFEFFKNIRLEVLIVLIILNLWQVSLDKALELWSKDIQWILFKITISPRSPRNLVSLFLKSPRVRRNLKLPFLAKIELEWDYPILLNASQKRLPIISLNDGPIWRWLKGLPLLLRHLFLIVLEFAIELDFFGIKGMDYFNKYKKIIKDLFKDSEIYTFG